MRYAEPEPLPVVQVVRYCPLCPERYWTFPPVTHRIEGAQILCPYADPPERRHGPLS